MAFTQNHRRQGSDASFSSALSESPSTYEQSPSSTYTSSTTPLSGSFTGSGSSTPHATCAYPSWPGGRSLKTPQPNGAPSGGMKVRQYEASPVPFDPVPKRTQSTYSSGASSFLSDEDLMVPESSTAYRPIQDDDLDDCLAPGYHCLSGRPRAPEPKFKWERNGDKTRKNSRPSGPKKPDPRQQIRMPTKKGTLNG